MTQPDSTYTFIDEAGELYVGGHREDFEALRAQGEAGGEYVAISNDLAIGIADLVKWLRERVPNHVPAPDAASSLAGAPGSTERAFNEAEGDRSE